VIQDEDDDLAAEALRAGIIRRARTEGVAAAYEAALEIVRDKSAPAVARASSQRTLLAVGGLLDRQDRNAEATKAVSEMSPEELAREVERLKRLRGKPAPKAKGDLFD
jgi:hypothetical protein